MPVRQLTGFTAGIRSGPNGLEAFQQSHHRQRVLTAVRQKRRLQVLLLVSINTAADHPVPRQSGCLSVRDLHPFGEEWVPQWRFEQLLRQFMRERPALSDDKPAPRLPFEFRVLLPISRRIERLAGAFRSPYTPSMPSGVKTDRTNATTAAAAAAQRPRTPLGVG